MYFLWVAQKDLKLYIRDRRALLLTIAMPLILIGILGAAFSNMFADDSASQFSPFELGVVNLDQGHLGKAFTEDLLGTRLQDIMLAHTMDLATLEQRIGAEELRLGIIIPANFTTNLLAGDTTNVEIRSYNASIIEVGILESVLRQFGQNVQVNQMVGKQIVEELRSNPSLQNLTEEQIQQIIEEKTAAQLQRIDQEIEYIQEQGTHSEAKIVTAFQYYAVGMGVMFLLMAVIQGVAAMVEEKEDPVIHRLLVTNMRFSDYLLGKLIGLIITCGLQMAVIILGTHFLFGVDWGASIFGVLFIAFAYVIAASGLGVLLGSFIHKSKTLSNIGMISVQIMAALGGSMIPLYFFPDWLNQAAKILPNALALQSFIELMSGAHFGEVYFSGVIMIGTGILFILLGWIKLSAEGRVKYA